eukprot:523345_1
MGISKLSVREIGSYKLYSGLNNVKLDKPQISKGYFPSYVSTTWIKNVSMTFIEVEGMIIQFDEKYRSKTWVDCCDVSWISRFPDECEVLIARSTKYNEDDFKLSILDEHNGIQTVSLE